MKLFFPIALVLAWSLMVGLTMADFAGFYAATKQMTAPVAQASAQPRALREMGAVQRPPREVRALGTRAARAQAPRDLGESEPCTITEALHD